MMERLSEMIPRLGISLTHSDGSGLLEANPPIGRNFGRIGAVLRCIKLSRDSMRYRPKKPSLNHFMPCSIELAY